MPVVHLIGVLHLRDVTNLPCPIQPIMAQTASQQARLRRKRYIRDREKRNMTQHEGK